VSTGTSIKSLKSWHRLRVQSFRKIHDDAKMSAMITATAWVPRGFAAQFPTRKEFDEEEFERIAGLTRGQLDDARAELVAGQGGEEEEEEEGEEGKEGKGGKEVGMEMEMEEDEDEDGGVKVTEEGAKKE